jgi:hypothetical protein
MPSWTLNEYLSAFNSSEFKRPNDILVIPDDVEEKFFVAGGCARWMFLYTTDQAIEDIKLNISKVTDMTLLSQGLQGTRSETSISHLFCVFENQESFLVSEYVTRVISEICQFSFLIEARNSPLAKSNPTFDGWVFEAEFLYEVRRSEKNSAGFAVFMDFNQKIIWDVASRVRFNEVVDIKAIPDATLGSVWFVPLKWNQACYGAVQLLKGGSFRFIQVTKALSHP